LCHDGTDCGLCFAPCEVRNNFFPHSSNDTMAAFQCLGIIRHLDLFSLV
jgi:hypothetical protein